MRIVLVYPEWTTTNRFPSRPPLGLAYLAAAVSNHDCIIVDQQLDRRPLPLILEQYRPDILGFSLTTWTFRQTQHILQQLRELYPNVLYVAGGPHPTAMPEQTLQIGFDVAVRSYGEETFSELVEALDQRTDLSQISGISIMDHQKKEVIHTPPRKYVRKLDELLPPLYSAFDLEQYQWCSIASSRGCAVGCLFCVDSHLFGRRVQFRSPESFVSELRHTCEHFGVSQFYIVDEQFTVNESRAAEICRLIIESGLNIRWQVNSRVDHVTVELLRKMKEAGCISIAFGIESGSEAILKRVHKGIDRSKILRAIGFCKEVGIHVKTSWIVGLPGSFEEQLASISLMQQAEPDHIDVYLLTIYPGTPLWNHADDYGIFVDRENLPLTVNEKLDPSRYRLAYLSTKQILEVGRRITETMLAQGYQLARPGQRDYAPGSKVLATYLQGLEHSGGSYALLK